MCHPGKPLPHGLSHSICRFSPGAENFQSAKVGGIALFADVDALAGLLALEVESREVAVVRLLRRVEVDAVGRPIAVAVLLDVGDEGDLLRDVVGRPAQHRGILDVERLHVGNERRRYRAARSPRPTCRSAGALLHLVFAGVGIGGEMADIGDVHHMANAVAVPLESALQQVLEQERPVVADVLIVVDRRAAGVEADFAAGVQRLERAQRSREVVVKTKRLRHWDIAS
jgi:hypothetical protein